MASTRVKIHTLYINRTRTRTLTFFFFGKILQLDKFEGADFKYDNNLLKLLPVSNHIRHFWSQN